MMTGRPRQRRTRRTTSRSASNRPHHQGALGVRLDLSPAARHGGAAHVVIIDSSLARFLHLRADRWSDRSAASVSTLVDGLLRSGV